MSVYVRIIGEKDNSDEYLASERLKEIIENSIPNTAIGEVVLFPSATLYGQAVKDVDIMMVGDIKNYSAKVKLIHEGTYFEEEVYLNTFCTTIEIKSHSISGIRKEGTNIQVYYSNSGWHNATKQSNDQKISAMNFFNVALGESPYITNLLWLSEINESELDNLLSYNNNVMPSNVLPAYFDFSKVVQQLVLQRSPRKYNNRYIFECNFNGKDADCISKPLMFLSKAKMGMGELTRKKIEQITDSHLGENEPLFDGNALNVFRGKAGTGKTIDLIKIAIKLVDEKSARVQILTYNRALVSDIRRLFTLAQLPDMFSESCVSVNTMQSFFYALINGCLYDGKLTGERFLDEYPVLMNEMIEFLKSDPEAKEIIKCICEDNPKLNWDYILVDEAQDWSEPERDLLLLLYDRNKIIIADGGQQFVRTIEPCDWMIVSDKNIIKLKYCLRQKRNLVNFINHVSECFCPGRSLLIQKEELVGGRILIVLNTDKFFHTIKVEKNELMKSGNEPYDMLFLVPSTLVEKKDSERQFSMLKVFEKNNILLWDGVNEENRLEFSVNLDESRVLQYESARGLEGWTVCCMNYDEYLENKDFQYNPEQDNTSLFLENAIDKKNKYMLNWALIPLTRAIDTLIITFKDSNSKYAKDILNIAEKHSDFITII